MGIKKNVGYNMLLTISNLLFPIISFPYAARILGPSGIGEANFAQNFCQYFIIFAALGVTLYGVRETAKVKFDSGELTKRFLELSIIRIVSTIVILIPYLVIILTANKFKSNPHLYYWGVLFIIINAASFEWFFTGIENFKYITIRSLLTKLVALILLFCFVKTSKDVVPYFLVNISTFVFNGFYNIKFIFKFIDLKKIGLRGLTFYRHIKPLFLIFSGILAINVYTLLDTIILGFLQTDKSVGLYNAATKITKIVLAVITSISTVLAPRLVYALSQNNQDEVSKLLKNSVSFVLTFSIPLMIGIYVLAPELIQLLSGHEFGPAVLTLRILCPLIFIIGMASVFSTQILTPLAKDKLVMSAAIIGAIVSLSMNFILVPFFAENGSAVSNVAAEFVVTLLCFIFARKFIKIEIKLKEIFLNLLGALPFFLIKYALAFYIHSTILMVILVIILSSVVFFVFNIYIVKNAIFTSMLYKYTKIKYFNLKEDI